MSITKANKVTCPSGASRAAWVLPALAASLALTLTAPVTAQTFTTLYSFTAVNPNTLVNSDGAGPVAGLVFSGNTLYGTANQGGSSGWGTVFAVSTDGTEFTTLYSFTGGSDGGRTLAGLVLSGKTLYGTALEGGTGAGTVFAVNTDGTGFTTLYSFGNGSDGANPSAGLVLSGNTLYGTALGGSGWGTVFAVNTDGTGFTTLYSFTAGAINSLGLITNSDGATPKAGLVLSGNTLYGTAYYGGSSGRGTVFAVNTDGTGFTTLHAFVGGDDGANPGAAGLILSGNTLYGTAFTGGSSGRGTVFAVNTDGTGFTTLHSFLGGDDGANPRAGLILSGNTLYGTAAGGGTSGNGTVFAINTDGTGFTTLYSFTAKSGLFNSDGAYPVASLILSGDTLYGTANEGGSSGQGTVFSLSLPAVSAPQLTITPSGANVILTWSASATGFTLQSTTNLGPLASWTTNSPAPVVVNGQNVVTNPISGAQQFFRLGQ
jgi:uncharacterized repeat protein (TIGR03803 family)